MKKHRITLEEATQLLYDHASVITQTENVTLLNAPGRVLAQDIYAEMDLPPFHKSAQDGYAVRSPDLLDATRETPAILQVTGQLFAGSAINCSIEPGQAARVMTGASIPPGADCVARQEDTDLGMKQVKIFSSFTQNQNICFKGEDMKAGSLLFSKGLRLDWTHVATLAGQGITTVNVYRIPKVAVLTTGDELTTPGNKLEQSHLYDSNGPMLYARLSSLHMDPILLQPSKDDVQILAKEVFYSLSQCDVLITTGGVSVGAKDYMAEVGRELDAKVLFHGLAAKPGSPALAMIVDGKLVICLSGNPFAAIAIFETVVRPVLEHISGNHAEYPRRCQEILHGHFEKSSPTRRLIRARACSGDVFLSSDGHSSGMVGTLSDCNCIIDVPAGSGPLHDGESVSVIYF